MIRHKYRPANQPAKDNLPKAAALSYRSDSDSAPRVVASGEGKTAEKIIALAHEHDIPIYDDPVLTDALCSVDIESEIPPELYMVVAEVLAYIYRVAKNNTIK